MYFSFQISLYQGTEIAFKNALFLSFVQSAQISNLRKLLTGCENALLGYFLHLCVVIVIKNLHMKDYFN